MSANTHDMRPNRADRLYRHACLRGWRNLANARFLLSQYFTRIEIPSAFSIRPGCLLSHAQITVCGRARFGPVATVMRDVPAGALVATPSSRISITAQEP